MTNRIFFPMIVLILLCLAAAGCTPAEGPGALTGTEFSDSGTASAPDETEAAGIPREISLPELEQYTIIRGEDADEETIAAASELFTYLKKQCGLKISFRTDYLEKGETVLPDAKEIVIGETNRSGNYADLRYSDYTVSYENGRIFFTGGSPSALVSAVKWFCGTCVTEDRVLLGDLPVQFHASYPLENLTLCGVALKEYAVGETEGDADEELRNWIGTRAGIRRESENGYVIRLVADRTLNLDEVRTASDGREVLLYASAYLGDLSVAARYFRTCVTARSGDSIELKERVVIDLPDPEVPIPDVRTAAGSTKMVYAVTDKDPLSYTVGDEIVFACTLYADGTVASCPEFSWTCSTEDGKVYWGEADGSRGIVIVRIPATGAGFARLKVLVNDENGNAISEVRQSPAYGDPPVFSAGVDVDQLTTKQTEPADFDAFWAGEVAKLDPVAPDLLSMVKVEAPGSVSALDVPAVVAAGYDFYRVKIRTPDECGDAVGYLSVPKNAVPASLGITVVFNGYGVSDLSPYASPTNIVLNVCAHSIELGREASYYSDLSKTGGALYNYCFSRNDSRDTCYFRTMLLRDLQAVRFIKAYAGTAGVRIEGSDPVSLGVWNGNLRLYGGSQGAFQGIAVAALDDDVTDAYWWIPWMCDVNGMRSAFRPSYTQALRYYDTVYFGKRIGKDVRVTLTMGLGDDICPPSGVLALYNQMGGRVTMICKQGMTHGYTPQRASDTTYQKNK